MCIEFIPMEFFQINPSVWLSVAVNYSKTSGFYGGYLIEAWQGGKERNKKEKIIPGDEFYQLSAIPSSLEMTQHSVWNII